jgi:hypothetical protein
MLSLLTNRRTVSVPVSTVKTISTRILDNCHRLADVLHVIDVIRTAHTKINEDWMDL